MKVVDLSQEVHPEMQVYPAYPKPLILQWTKREVHGFEAEVVYMCTHTGTHVDAPYHVHPDGRRIHRMPAGVFVADAVLLSFPGRKPREHITLKEVKRALTRRGDIQKGKAVLFYTGWGERAGRREYLTENPAPSKEVAEYLVSKRASMVGIDCASIDHPSDPALPIHHILLRNSIPVIENLCNLGEINTPSFRLIALPLRIRGATGSPVRAVALID